MLGNNHFYHRSIRKIVVAFGTLFNDIEIIRFNTAGEPQERFKVPLAYAPKEKFITRLESDPTLTKSINTHVPRMSFNLDNISYDSSRKQISTTRNFAKHPTQSLTSIKAQFVPVPFNYEFSLSIYTRNTEDATQILEQILPFFTPDFNVLVDFIPELNPSWDIPIVFKNAIPTIEYEGDGTTTRLIIWDLTFTVKGYIWPPVQDKKYIRKAITNFIIEKANTDIQSVRVDFANGFGQFAISEPVRVIERDISGTVAYFSNTSNGLLVVGDLNKLLANGDIVIGEVTNAQYVVKEIDDPAYNVATLIVEPNPINADIDDNYGFTETIIYY